MKTAAEDSQAHAEILELLQSAGSLRDLMRQVTEVLSRRLDFQAVGIRLRAGDDYPYFETRGFPPEFVLAENRLCAVDPEGTPVRDVQGNPVLECMCGNILCGRFDASKPFFTAHGSFWTNCTTKLLAGTTEADRQARTRNRCNGEGYESVALIPLRTAGRTFGLLQLNDKREDRFTPERIAVLERIADDLALGMAHRDAEEALRESEERYRLVADFTRDWETWTGPDGRILYCSPSCVEATGYQAAEFVNDAGLLESIIHPDDREAFREHLRASDAEDMRGIEIRIRRRDGQVRVFEHVCRPVRGADGRFRGRRGSNRDIAGRKRAEEELRRSARLFDSIRKAQSLYIRHGDREQIFATLLETLISLTDSEYGFIDEVRRDDDGTPYKVSLALSNVAWDEGSKRLYDQLVARNREFRNLNNLAGAPVLTGRLVIANEPHADPRSGGLPAGHPPLRTFLGVPLYFGDDLVGVAGVANRPGGYDERIAAFLEPFASTCAGIIHAVRVEERERRNIAALREHEARLREAVKAGSVGLWDWDLLTDKVYFSPEWKRQIGYEDHEIGNEFREWQSRVHPDDLDRCVRYVRTFIENPQPGFSLEFRFRHKDGSYRWILAQASLLRGEDGRPARLLGSHVDITERKHAEETLRREATMRSLLLENLPCIAMILRKGSREIVYSNEMARRVGAVPGKTCYGTCAERSDPCPFCLAPEVWLTDTPRHREVEHAGKHYEGRWLPLTDDLYVHYIFDITERRRTELALRESERRLRLSLDAARAGAWVWNLETGEVRWDDRMHEIFGLEPGRFDGTFDAWKQCVHPDDVERVERAAMDALDRCEYYECEHRVFAGDGEVRHVRTSASVTGGTDGAPLQMAGIAIDITDRKRAEEEKAGLEAQLRRLQKLEAIGQLAAGIAHDFGNLATVIHGHAAQLADRFGDDPAACETLRPLQAAAEQALSLVRSLLLFGRETTGEETLLDLNALVEETAALVRHMLPKTVELEIETRSEAPLRILADKTQLQQVILNLASNARDAMPEGGMLRIAVAPAAAPEADEAPESPGEGPAFVRLSVSDTGMGILPEILPRIFDPFFTTKPRGQGTGLGLSIVHGIVDACGGRVDVRSSRGAGTTFDILLPCSGAGEPVAASTSPYRNGAGQHVLLAEGDPYVRGTLVAFLESVGYRVDHAGDAGGLADLLTRCGDDARLLVLDAALPPRGGLACLADVRRAIPGLPVVLLFAAEPVPPAAVPGPAAILTKPFSMAELAARADELLRANRPGNPDA